MKVQVFKDSFHNTATIEERVMLPYSGSPVKEKAFVLSVTADYERNYMFHRSIYSSRQDAINALKSRFNGTFKEIDLSKHEVEERYCII